MTDGVTCPGQDTLRRFLNGEVVAAEAERIEGHLHTCRHCLDALGRLDDRDSLVEALRRATPSPAPAAVIQRVVAQAEQLPCAGSPTAPDTSECRAEPTQSCPDVVPPIPPTAQGSLDSPDCPENLGRYRILGRIGSGGMGVVYLAEDPQFGRRVAIKVPRFGGSERNQLDGRRRFVREARTTAALRHPHICPVHDMGEHQEQLYVVMAYVPGSSLAEFLLARPRLAADEAVRLALQIVDALIAVHALGIVHRDLKPGNVLLDEHRQALLTDFGLAAGHEASDYPTLDGTVLGTPWYMAPEQARGKPGEVDARCDIYGLGVILYQMLSGRLPFEGSQTAVLGLLVSGAVPPPVEQHCPELDPVLAGIVNRAMARRPVDRFANATELAEALRRWQPPAEAVPPPAQPTSPSRRVRIGLVAGLALLGMALFFALKYVIRSDAPPPLPGKTAGTAALRWEALVSRPALLPGVRRWDIDTVGHRSPVVAVAYNRSGRWLATGGDDAVRIWDVRGGFTLARILPAGTAGKRFQGFAWGSREDELAVSWEGESLVVWNVAVGTRSKSLENAVGRVVNWSADGAVLLVVGTGGKPEWWDARTGKKLDGLDEALAVVALSPDGTRLAAARDTRLALYEVGKVGKPLWEDRVTANAEVVCWSPDGRRVAFAATGAKPRTWIVDAENRKMLFDLEGAPKPTAHPHHTALAWSADGTQLAVVVNSLAAAGIELFDADTGKSKKVLADLEGSVAGLALTWSPGGDLALGTASGSLHLVAADSGKVRERMPGHTPMRVTQLQALADHKELLVGLHPNLSQVGTLGLGWRRTWNLATGQQRARGPDTDCRWSPSGEAFVTATSQGTTLTVGGKDIALEGVVFPIRFSWSADGKYLLGVGHDGRGRVWRGDDGKKHAELTGSRAGAVALSPEAKVAVVRGELHDLRTGKVTPFQSAEDRASFAGDAVEWSADGSRLAVGDWLRGTVVIVAMPSLKKLGQFSCGRSECLGWSRDGRLLFTGANNAIRAWDWEKAEPRGVLLGLRDDLGLTISPSGHYQGCNARHLRYVVETDDGLVQTLTAEQFKKTHGWVNENDKAALIP